MGDLGFLYNPSLGQAVLQPHLIGHDAWHGGFLRPEYRIRALMYACMYGFIVVRGTGDKIPLEGLPWGVLDVQSYRFTYISDLCLP